MPNFNKVILVGNITRDIELRYTPKGTAVTRICLAVNRNWKDENGQAVTETTFVDIDVFGGQAETLQKYVRKGNPLLVEGRLKLDTWDDKQTGQRRSRMGVVLESFQFLGSGQRQGGESSGYYGAQQGGGYQSQPTQQPQSYAPSQQSYPSAPLMDNSVQMDEDVPF